MRCPLNEKHEYSVQHRMLVISSEDLIRWNTSEKTDEINNSCLTRSAGGALCCCSVTQLCPTLCDPVDYSTPGFPVLQYLPELAQTHVHWDSDAIQPTHPLPSPSPPGFNLPQHQDLFKWVSSSHQVAKVLEFLITIFVEGSFHILTDGTVNSLGIARSWARPA